MPLKVRAWYRVHLLINRLAWRYGMEPGWRTGMWGSADHIRKDHWLWRLNGWTASHWTEWWIEREKKRRAREQDRSG